ncbi:hypothetical protein D9M71_794810 [compost metagenome]
MQRHRLAAGLAQAQFGQLGALAVQVATQAGQAPEQRTAEQRPAQRAAQARVAPALPQGNEHDAGQA